MKKISVILLAIVMIMSFSGCSKPHNNSNGKLQIVTAVFPFYDFAKQVAGDKAEVKLLLPTGAEAHSYEPTAKDVVAIQESDLFICLGMGADVWTENIVNDSSFDKNNLLYAMECAELVYEGYGETNYTYDEHVWTSLRNSQKIIFAIADSLAQKDPENANYYRENAQEYADDLAELDRQFISLTEGNEKPLIFADRFPFKYFSEDYGLECVAAYPGCSAESEPSAATVAALIDRIKSENISVVLVTETSNGQLADAICEETGAKKMTFHSCHTVTKQQLQSEITYLDLMKQNFEVLEKIYS